MTDANEVLRALLQPGDLNRSIFPPSSRYFGVELAWLEVDDDLTIIYLRRRFVPAPEEFVQVQEHLVVERDRLDNIAAQYLGDPEQFWRVCDANRALRPEALTETIGRRLRITLPEGIPGTPNA